VEKTLFDMQPEVNTGRPVIFTWGYQSRTMADLLELIKRYQITLVIDVRSKPYSCWQPAFNRRTLEKTLGSFYTWRGHDLGGQDWTPDSRIIGCNKLIDGFKRHSRICLMCLERDPRNCHRTELSDILQILSDFECEAVHL